MYLLYVDDAGSAGNHEERHFVLGGVALFERHVEHLERAMDKVATNTQLADPSSLEFHGNQLLPGSKRWRAIRGIERRRTILADALRAGNELRGKWAVFGVVVHKAAVSPRDPVEFAFEQLCSRFDYFLGRQVRDGKAERGLIILDKSTLETRLQDLASAFRREGHSWGKLRRVVDVPFFVDSRATRAIPYADLVTYALWRKFEKDDSAFFEVIRDRFDTHGGIVHGLLHERYAEAACDCPYCLSRRRAASAGDGVAS
ncbi:MAG: DUF3800 domain-containing protein [Rhodobacteraceae bacterium]|nr:DUF3800 domain-containing protein [Paracoccaceae bacterium]